VLSLRQSGTLDLSYVQFFRAQHGKTAHKMIDTYHVPQAKSASSGTLWVMQNNATA
jgi:hypothetical protein